MTEPNKTKKYHYVYEITNIYNGMRYIGARSSKVKPALDTKYMSSSKTLKKEIKKEGLDHFSKLILATFSTREKAIEYEIFLHNRFNVNEDSTFYNKAKQTSTGFDYHPTGIEHPMFGKHHTEETKDKIKIASTGRISWFKGKKHTEEARKKLSAAKKGKYVGEKNPAYGKPKSEEAKQKNREAHLGKHPSEKTRKKLSEKRKKKILPLDTRKNISNAKKGEKSVQYGKHLSIERRNKIGESLQSRTAYIYITPLGEFIHASDAGKALQCSTSTIIKRCKDLFEGYGLKLAENRKESIRDLIENGYTTTEIAKELGITRHTVWNWKIKLGLLNQVRIKLTTTKILEIRYLYDMGIPIKIIQKEFGIGQTHVLQIGKRKSWPHIPEELPPIDPDWQKNYCC